MGFTFLEANQLVVDCNDRALTRKGRGATVTCCPVQDGNRVADRVQVQRFRIQGQFPPYPRKRFPADAAWDFFAPTDIRIRPGDRVTIDTGMACAFPKGTWCLLKEKSGLAHRYGLMVLGGVIDGNYRGRIKVILHNTGREMVTIPRHAAFCQGVLLPTASNLMVPGQVDCRGDRADDGGVNRELARERATLGNSGRHGLGAVADRG